VHLHRWKNVSQSPVAERLAWSSEFYPTYRSFRSDLFVDLVIQHGDGLSGK
jgi:hypothetical protein